MRHIVSDELGAFSAFYDEDVELISVTRANAGDCEVIAKQLVEARQIFPSRWVQQANDSAATAHELSAIPDAEAREALVNEIGLVSDVFSELLGCEQVGIRLEPLSGPMCPRFHVDNVPCRLLATLSGCGTEWIPNQNVDWEAFADLGLSGAPLRTDSTVQQLATGNWSLLKGGAWDEAFNGVVHRSPHQGGDRLLLSLDPVF